MKSLDAGQVLFEAGGAGTELAVVTSGSLNVEACCPVVGSITIAPASEGTVVGWESLLPDKRALFTLRAREPARVFVVEDSQLESLKEAAPHALMILTGEALRAMRQIEHAARRLAPCASQTPLPNAGR